MLVIASGGIGGVFTDDTSVVYGSNSADLSAATSMQTYLGTFGPLSLNTTIISGELAPIKTSSQPLYLNDIMRDTKSTFTDNELPTVLASGEVDDFDYDLKIEVPNTEVLYNLGDNEDTPVINADFESGGEYTFKIIFPTPIELKDLEGEAITLFGKNYEFSEDDLDEEELVLYENINTVRVIEGTESVVNGNTISVIVTDNDEARVTVNGNSKTVEDGWSGIIGDVDLSIKDITYQEFSGGYRLVDLFINSQKLVLSHGNEVELGSEDIDGTNVEIISSSEKIREIIITATPKDFDDEVEYLKLGDSFIDPVFGTVKFSLDTVSPELKSSERDFIEVKTSGDDSVEIQFINKAGGEYDFEFIDNDEVTFKTESPLSEGDYFITAINEYTQVWEVEDVDYSDKEATIRDIGDSDSITISFDSNDGAEFNLADGSTKGISINNDDTLTIGTLATHLYTEDGARINFDFGIVTETEEVCSNYTINDVNPNTCYKFNITTFFCEPYTINDVNLSSCHDVIINSSVTASKIIITEETDYNGGKFTDNDGNELGTSIEISIENLGNDDDLELKLESGIMGDDDNRYLLTSYGTFVKEFDKEKVEVYYPEEAMEINFHIGEISSKITTISDSNTTVLKLTDSSASTSLTNNIVVVGGPCINTVAAQLLGEKTCGVKFTTATGVGSGKALIQVFANPFNSNGKAILVAGYEAGDTSRAIEYLKVNQIDLTIGNKIII